MLIAGVSVAYAMTNAEIQQNIISRLYKGAGGRVSCDYDGYVTTPGRHEGIDIVCRSGAPIYAVFNGTVTGRGVSDSGVTVLAVYNSEYNVTIVYEHANFSVSKGASVSVGDRIGTEASNGTKSAHTHFELRIGSRSGGAKNGDSTLENPNPYPYYAKMFGGSSKHTVDGSYPTPITAIPRSTSGDVQVYDVDGNAESNRWISPGDRCTINAVYTDGWLEVIYPTGSGNRTAYVKKDVFFASNTIINASWSPSSNVKAYAYSNLTEKLGEVWTTDRCVVVGQSGSNYQVIYPLSSGGYKLGWVSTDGDPVPVILPDQVDVPGPVAAGIFDGKSIVVMAPSRIDIASNEYISAGDICIIHDVNSSTGYCTATYPSGGTNVFASGTKTKDRTVAMTNFVEYQPSFALQKITTDESFTVYPTSAMTQNGTNWSLDSGDEFYTVARSANGATEVLYYCTRGAHAGYWKLGWVDLPYYSLDLNGWLDGASAGDLGTYGAADVYVNGNKLAQNARDFYSANGTFPRGSTYEIKNIVAAAGCTYNGVHSGSASGTLKGNVSVFLDFTKDPVTLSDIRLAKNPTKLEYLEGQDLDAAGLKVEAVYSDGTTSDVTGQCTLSGYDNTPGVKTVMVTYSGKSTAFTVVVKSKTPTSLVVSSNPTKTSYRIGEELNLDGLKVTATYDNGTSEVVDEFEVMIEEGVTSSAGTKTIDILYDYNNVSVATTFEIVVQAGPVITAQPSNYVGPMGTKATFTVVATGTDLSYQWQWSRDNGQTWTNSSSTFTGYRSASLQIPISEARNGYLYRCIVTDVSGDTVTSNAARLTIGSAAPTITTQPANYTGALGTKATFTVVATGADLTYQWQWSRDNGATWTNSSSTFEGNRSASMKVPISAARNNYLYRCIVTSSTGEAVTSNAARLTVAADGPTITTHPSNYTGALGTKATFTVVASGTNLTYRWQWSRDNGVTWANSSSACPGYNTASMQVPITEARNGYLYRCVVMNASGATATSNAAKLTIGAAGLAITTQPKNCSGAVNTTATFTVVASGTNLYYQWQWSRDNGTTWSNSSSAMPGYNTAKLSVPITSARNNYLYRCIVYSAAGEIAVSAAAKLTVSSVAALAITSQPKDYVGDVGETAKFTVAASGEGLAYQWQYCSATGSNWANSSQSGSKTNTLSVPITVARDGQRYRCVITDSAGNKVISDAGAIVIGE